MSGFSYSQSEPIMSPIKIDYSLLRASKICWMKTLVFLTMMIISHAKIFQFDGKYLDDRMGHKIRHENSCLFLYCSWSQIAWLLFFKTLLKQKKTVWNPAWGPRLWYPGVRLSLNASARIYDQSSTWSILINEGLSNGVTMILPEVVTIG